MLSYEPLNKTLKKRGLNKMYLREYISSATVSRMTANKAVSLKTIDKLCKLLDCKIQDIVIYVKEPPELKK